MRTAAIIVSLILAGPAWAQGFTAPQPPPVQPPQTQSQSQSQSQNQSLSQMQSQSARARAQARAASTASATGGAANAAGGSATGGSSSSGGNTLVSRNQASAAAATAFASNSTAPCTRSAAIGGAGPFVGASISIPFAVPACELVFLAQAFDACQTGACRALVASSNPYLWQAAIANGEIVTEAAVLPVVPVRRRHRVLRVRG